MRRMRTPGVRTRPATIRCTHQHLPRRREQEGVRLHHQLHHRPAYQQHPATPHLPRLRTRVRLPRRRRLPPREMARDVPPHTLPLHTHRSEPPQWTEQRRLADSRRVHRQRRQRGPTHPRPHQPRRVLVRPPRLLPDTRLAESRGMPPRPRETAPQEPAMNKPDKDAVQIMVDLLDLYDGPKVPSPWDDCVYDFNGYCTAHGWKRAGTPCPVTRAHQYIDRFSRAHQYIDRSKGQP